MTLIYKFKKEKLENGLFVERPRILVVVSGSHGSIEMPALIDSGSDMTVIPEGIANAIGIEKKGNKSNMFGFREVNEVMISRASITFSGKAERESVRITIPVLIALGKEHHEEETDIVLGVQGVFDNFVITFKKAEKKILLKRRV